MPDLVVIGGGVVGLALADAWLARSPGDDVVVYDKETHVACHEASWDAPDTCNPAGAGRQGVLLGGTRLAGPGDSRGDGNVSVGHIPVTNGLRRGPRLPLRQAPRLLLSHCDGDRRCFVCPRRTA